MRLRTGPGCILVALFLWLIAVFPAPSFPQSATGTLRGQVTDPSGSAVPGASVLVTPAGGQLISVTTNRDGVYEVKNLAPGTYDVQVLAKGFAIFESKEVTVTANQIQKLDVPLVIEQQKQKVVVESEASNVDVNPENNVGAIVLKQDDLKALSDDPDELQSDLEALAGPSAGPNGGQIYIDGFTAGQLPPKSAIREIRINQNPFSSEYDKLGYGRIEIFTKPGTDQWHGSAQLQGNDSSFNSKNPFASGTEPGYYSTLFNGNLGGPISKKASLFISGQYRDINDVAVINAQVLDSNFQPTPFSASVAQPRTRTNLGPRVDYQLSKNNTLSVRYQYFRDNQDNNGLSGFSLPTQAFNILNTEHTLQVSDTQVFGTTIVNDIHFQYIHDGENQIASSALPTVVVPSSFTGGGNNQQNVNDIANHYELQNYTQWVHGTHTIKFGVRLRQTVDTNNATSAFNGNYTFSSLIAYQTTEQGLAAGLPFSQIQAMGGGAIQLSLNNGVPQTYVSVFDSGWYIQDDWRVRPNLTLSGGLRLEQQTGIADHLDWEPRVALAWGIGSAKSVPKTVLRIGTGLFYDRFAENLILQANRLNGINQEKFVVTSPCFFNPNSVPSISVIKAMCPASTVLPTTYSISPRLHAPGTIETAVTLEQQLGKSASVSVSYLNSRGYDQLLSNNINTPLPGTFPANPVYPLGTPGNVYQFQSGAIYRQNELISQVNCRFRTRISLRGYYALNYANSNTAGANQLPFESFQPPAGLRPRGIRCPPPRFSRRLDQFAAKHFSLPILSCEFRHSLQRHPQPRPDRQFPIQPAPRIRHRAIDSRKRGQHSIRRVRYPPASGRAASPNQLANRSGPLQPQSSPEQNLGVRRRNFPTRRRCCRWTRRRPRRQRPRRRRAPRRRRWRRQSRRRRRVRWSRRRGRRHKSPLQPDLRHQRPQHLQLRKPGPTLRRSLSTSNARRQRQRPLLLRQIQRPGRRSLLLHLSQPPNLPPTRLHILIIPGGQTAGS